MSRRKGDAWKHRPHYRAFYRLSDGARQRALAGFRQNESTTGIVAAIGKDFGERIPVASLNRYREWWAATERPVLEASDKVDELLRAFKGKETPEIEQVIRQLLMAQRLTAMTEDRTPDPNELGWLDLGERKLRLEEQKLALRERELERKVASVAGKAERTLKKKGLDEATIETIRTEIYGLAPRKPSAA
jgi:hypothetical protein